MAISKIILNGVTQIDLTQDTAQNADVVSPKTYHKADGTTGTGSITAGTEGIPTATKGTVSNHSISVTPSVTNTGGIISGGTHSGTAVTVSASELVSGTKSITQNGTGIDVANYANVDVSIPVGEDIPVYTITWDSSYNFDYDISHLQSITCNYTYSQLNNYYSNEAKMVVAVAMICPGFTFVSAATITNFNDPIDGLEYCAVTIVDEFSLPRLEIQHCIDNTIVAVAPGTAKTLNATTNGTYTPVDGVYTQVTVNVSTSTPSLQAKTNIAPTTSSQTITADSGYDGLSSVQINAIPSQYIVPSGTINITSSGTKDVTNYASASIPALTLPSSASSTSSGTSKATISRSTSNQYINIPTGFNNTAQYYTISATPNGTATAPSSISGTSASISTGSGTLTLTKTVSVTPNVSTAGYISSGTAGNSSVSLTANMTIKGTATITPTTTSQTIAANTYISGAQTIAGDANLVGSNIISGKSIFGVAGTVSFQTIYTGSSAPSSSTGVNGDIYIQT